jgi:single-stranded DNA-specific DHH superfamily exonuclease
MLNSMNAERKQIEQDMQEVALIQLELYGSDAQHAIVAFDENWHQGVIGILASRLKDKFYRPVIAFAPGDAGLLKGSGRSIPGFHMRDALDLVSKRYPDLISKFGGHAMAAGLTIAQDDLPRFSPKRLKPWRRNGCKKRIYKSCCHRWRAERRRVQSGFCVSDGSVRLGAIFPAANIQR